MYSCDSASASVNRVFYYITDVKHMHTLNIIEAIDI